MSTFNRRQELLESRLIDALKNLFPNIDEETVKELQPYFNWVELEGGEALFKQGDHSDSICILLSGRLQAVKESPNSAPFILGEIYRGQTVGEMGIFTGEPRNASVYAVRNSVLVVITTENYLNIVSKFPMAALNTGKLIIDRLNPGKQANSKNRSTNNLCILPINHNFPIQSFIDQYTKALKSYGSYFILDRKKASEYLNYNFENGAAPTSYDLLEFQLKFDKLEESYDFVHYLADFDITEWTKICLKQADEIYLVAESSRKQHELSTAESRLVFGANSISSARKHLVLLHPADTKLPEGTRHYLEHRTLELWHHLRDGHIADFQRISRFIAGRAIGFALAGGGAKGFVHLGVFKAFREHNIPLDMLAGTSAGALAVSILAQMLGEEEGYNYMKNLARDSPTKGSNRSWLPLVSLLKGSSLDSYLKRYFGHIYIEDLWIQSSIAAANIGQTSVVIFDRGPLNIAIRASIALPGIFPPAVYKNELYVDGATISNLPLFALRNKGLGYLGAIALHQPKLREVNYPSIPDTRTLLFDKILGRRKYKVPSIISVIMNSMVLASHSQLNDIARQADIFLCPDTSKISLMDWMKYDPAIEIGYNHALEHIDDIKNILVS